MMLSYVIMIDNMMGNGSVLIYCQFTLQTYAEMDPTTAALEKEHEAVT